MKITVLNDNRCQNPLLNNEHGLSLYIEYKDKKMLLDTGASSIFKRNADKLNINVNDINVIFLSHGHYDHANGLEYIDSHPPLIMHPDCCNYRQSKRTKTYGGMSLTHDELMKKFDLIETKEPYEYMDNVYFLGEIKRNNNFETLKFPMITRNGLDDQVGDDSGIVIKTRQGIVVISGCAHSGICNTIEHAKEVTHDHRVLAVMGGFHLKENDEVTHQTIKYMIDNHIEHIYLAHCTSDIVCDEFVKCLKEKVTVMSTGETYQI
ncbi:MAG: MBL fold metallo-hydrolase [Erysipelotrichaceae bacterium]|nr:MBL fold metallo-hydrolase [Erysipelotrichaceae bacterium]